MNQFEKVFCRTYQTAFRAALPVLPYRRPKALKNVSELSETLRAKQIKRVLIVTDAAITKIGLYEPLCRQLKSDGIRFYVYDRTVANPTTDNVEEALQLYHVSRCEAIIGFGGGSSIDCAKAVGARVACPNKPLSKMEGLLKICRRLPLLIAVPTTAGTGSETTLAAVITDSKTRHKYPINDFSLIPSYALLDPDVTLGLPPHLTATTGLDALTHAVEAYIGRSTTAGTREDARQAVRLIFENLPAAVQNGQNREARKCMLYAAYLAGNAFTRSYVGYVHGIAHSLGGKYNIPHGYANAVLLPVVLEQYGAAAHRKLTELAVAAGLCEEGTVPSEGAAAFIEAVREMKRNFGIGDTFPELRREDIPELARYAAHECNPLYPVPVEMNAAELEHLYELVLVKEKEEVA